MIIGFVRRWWTPVHFAIMTANELMATMLPAAAAAGAATLVGWQGVEQMIPRFQAINQTAEALGGAYGITSGSYLGTGSALQRAQDLATGGVYELGGAGINLARMGAGGFAQTGLNTIAMLDRGVADMQINMQNRGTMKLLQSLAGGGTDYLRQFGDIGANFGNILLGLAPHLPGVGGDYLSLLEGVTGALGGGIGFMNQHGLGGVLGAGMAGEAGWRIGRPVVGLLGRLLSSGGMGLANLGRGTWLSDLGLGMADAGGALGMLGGPEVALAALAAFGIDKAWTQKTGAQSAVAGMQAGITQAGFTGAWQPLAQAITKTTGLGTPTATSMRAPTRMQLASRVGAGLQAAYNLSDQHVYAQAATGFAGQLGDLVGAGPQLVKSLLSLKDSTGRAVFNSMNMGDAFQIAQNSLLDLSHAFDAHGHLTKQAQQMLKNYVTAIGPMTRSGGAFNAAVGAQQIMSSPAMQDLSKVNQAMDSMTQIMQAGPAGMAALAGTAQKLNAPAMAKALTSFTTPGGAAAWTQFASTSPTSVISQMQQFNDQMRTGMTLGAISGQGAAGLTGYELKQFLPQARQSPAALAMLMQQGAQMGVTGYYDPSKSQAQNYAAAVAATSKIADNAQQANRAMTSMTVHLANIPAVAKQFVQGTGAQIQAQQVAKAAQDAMNIKGGINVKANVADLVAQLKAAGVQGGAALKASLDAVLTQAGVSKAARIKIEAQVTGLSQVQSALAALKDKQVHAKVNVDGAAQLQALEAQIAHLKSKSVQAAAHVQGAGAVAALNAQIAALRSKEVTITTRMITIGGMAGVTRGIPAGIRAPGMQTGGLVPGSGSGDIIPAMLEPGEVVIPRSLVPLIAPILTAHRVPGFGGMPQSSASHFAAGGVAGGGTITGNAGHQFAFTLIDEITKALKSAGAQKIAQALVNKIGQEVQYAKQVASGVTSGLNLGGMDLTQGSVLGQMQNYLASSQAFGTDLTRLRKGHLNKDLIAQIVAAGPVQGDMLAQSILGTGIGGVNKVWGQIGHSANVIGAQAAMAQYGGMLAPNLKSGTFTSNNVTVNINAGHGATLSLTEAQIKALVAKIQAELLKQAKRNPRTGLQLSGKGA